MVLLKIHIAPAYILPCFEVTKRMKMRNSIVVAATAQGCRLLPHARTPVAYWNDCGRVRLKGSQARLACSYFAKVQPCGPDFTNRNRTQVNTYFFVRFHIGVKVNSLAFAIGNFRPYSSEFVSQHVAAVFGLSSNQPPEKRKKKKQCGEKGTANPVYELVT